MKAGELRIFVDCGFTADHTGIIGSAQSTDVSLDIDRTAGAKYWCSAGYNPPRAVDANFAAWRGVLAPGEVLSPDGEVSIGQRMACNATTADTARKVDR